MSVKSTLRTTLVAALAAGTIALLPAASAVPAQADAVQADAVQADAVQADAVQPRAAAAGSYVALVSRGKRTNLGGIDTRRQSLQVLSPTGVRSTVWSTAVTRRGHGYTTLSDVSADGGTALLTQGLGRRMSRTRALAVDTATGAVRVVDIARGYTVAQLAPDGTGLLLLHYRGRRALLATLGWDGALRQTDVNIGGRMLALDATTVLDPTAGRDAQSLDAVSLAAGAIARRYPTPGLTCSPVRRWDPSSVLLSCYAGRRAGQALRLLDTTTGVLSAVAANPSGTLGSNGDYDARVVAGAIYVQTTGPCGFPAVARVDPDGRRHVVRVPGRKGLVTVLGSVGSSLALQTGGACRGAAPRQSLTLLDPATGAAQPLVVLPGKESFDRIVAVGERQASVF